MNDESDILKTVQDPYTMNFFRKTYVQYLTVRLVRIWTYKMGTKKNIKKKRTKVDGKRILCKFIFFRKLF